MSATTITAERASQVDVVVRKFVATFVAKPLQSPDAIDAFKSVYHPDIEWYDHAFLICRRGHEALLGLQRSFMHCNDPFKIDIKAITPTAAGAVLEQVWIGRCSNNIVRPDGEIAVKASGKDFKCHVCMIIAINDEGKITRIDEYYNKLWDNGKEETEYAVLGAARTK